MAAIPYSDHDLVGIEEIAQMGYTDVETARKWLEEPGFPPPAHTLTTGDLWDRQAVYKFMLETGKRGVPKTVG